MTLLTAALLAVTWASAAGASAQPPSADEGSALRSRLEARYDLLPLTGGVALRPKVPDGEVRLIEVAEGAVSINGVPVTGRELRDRVGADADSILQLSYLSPEAQRALFPPPAPAPSVGIGTAEPLERTQPAPPEGRTRHRRSVGDRVRVFGDVTVREDEEVAGQVVAVLGSVRVDGEVGDQVVAILGSVELGPSAVVRGDVVTVGGRVRRAAGAQTRGGVTEVALSDGELRMGGVPWFGGWAPVGHLFGPWGAVPRLIGTGFRVVLLLLLAGIVFVIARRSVEASAQRVSDNPLKVTVVGLIAEVMILPVLILGAIVLAISIIGIPLLLLLPFVVLFLLVLALVGFTGTAAAVGRAAQRRFGPGGSATFISIVVGVLVILSPLLLGRILALAGWPVTPFAMLLIALGFAVELVAWASGFGAVLTNAFNRWQAPRAARVTVPAPPPG